MRAARELRQRDSEVQVLRTAEVGLRVRRGPDWSWGNQDGGGPGTTIEGGEVKNVKGRTKRPDLLVRR